jgi:hypothetical protein
MMRKEHDMPTELTPEELAERLLTPQERHQRDQERLRQQANRFGGWGSQGEQKAAERRQAERQRKQDAALAERQKADAEAEQRRQKARREIEDELLAPTKARRWAEFVAAHPGKSEGYFENVVWPELRPIALEDALRERADDLYRRMGGGVGRM